MVDREKIVRAIGMILEAIGEDPQREGLRGTPQRVAKMYTELFSGMGQDPGDPLKTCFQADGHDEIVLVKDIPFSSICEHHLLPFYGKAHVAYIPARGRIVGLSKLIRVIDIVSRRPQLQERLTTTVADTVNNRLAPKGVVVVIEAEHLCMNIRGVNKPGALTVTSAVRGVFRSNASSREEIMSLIKGKR